LPDEIIGSILGELVTAVVLIFSVCSSRHHADMIAIMFEHLISHLPDDAMRRRKLTQGAWLFHQGDTVGLVYFVVAGCVELVRHTQAGKPAILQRAEAV
jgi:CRP-like cAMP-binding protein